MTNELATPEAQSGTAPPAEGATPEQGTSPPPEGATPGTSAAAPDGATPKPRGQERIEELSARAKAGIEYGEFWRQRFEESQKQQAKPPESQEDARPKRADFDDEEAWADALTAWSDRRADTRAEAAAERRYAREREQERLRGMQSTFQSRAEAFTEAHPDFRHVISNPALTFMNGEFLTAIMEHDKGPDLAYRIGKDAKTVARLAGMSIPRRLAELGRIEAELSRPPPPPKVSTAPPPPTPIGGGGEGGGKDPSKMTAQEYLRWRLESRAKR